MKKLLILSAVLLSINSYADNLDDDDDYLARGRNGEIDDIAAFSHEPNPDTSDPIGPFYVSLQDIPGARGQDGGVGKSDV